MWHLNRAREGRLPLLDTLFRAAQKHQRPNDGNFVTFWRILLTYPKSWLRAASQYPSGRSDNVILTIYCGGGNCMF